MAAGWAVVVAYWWGANVSGIGGNDVVAVHLD